MNVHFIAIGGSAMHNLALALNAKGHHITGSDDEIFEPSRGRLASAGILPPTEGWEPERIHQNLDAIILGMHAREDNPELLKARKMGLQVFSYPEFIYDQCKNKQRVVIGGSHGKTTITSMVMHLLNKHGRAFDYLVGAKIEGFDHSVLIDEDHDLAIIEGDEYLASPIDRRPKFHLYHPHIALISGIAWDHVNVFPSFENYLEQFGIFIDRIEPGGHLIYCEEDPEVKRLVESHPRMKDRSIVPHPYHTPAHRIQNGSTILVLDEQEVPLKIFGRHNLQNLEGAKIITQLLGISEADFARAIVDFTGASRRLEKLHDDKHYTVFRDFAHAPSKLSATCMAAREQYPDRKLIACIELHTFSSLNKAFLSQYESSMDSADEACVFYSPEVLAHKKLPPITEDDVKAAFKRPDLKVFTDIQRMQQYLDGIDRSNTLLLLMSSGNWQGGVRW